MVSSELPFVFGTFNPNNTLPNDYRTNKNFEHFDAMKNFDQAPSICCKDDHIISNDHEVPFKGFVDLNNDNQSNKNNSLKDIQGGSAVDNTMHGTQRSISSVESLSSLEKLERRDSGFHTLSRSSKCNGGVSPLADSSDHSTVGYQVSMDNSSKQSLSPKDVRIDLCIDCNLVSNPSMVNKAASKEAMNGNKCENKSLIAQNLFHMKGFDRQDVVKYLTSK